MDQRLHFAKELTGPLRVPPGSEVDLSRDHDPGSTAGMRRQEADVLLAQGATLLAGYRTCSPPRTPGPAITTAARRHPVTPPPVTTGQAQPPGGASRQLGLIAATAAAIAAPDGASVGQRRA